MTDADDFRQTLLALALRKDWASWDATRLIFGDWLEDHDLAERFVARANWKLVWHKTWVYQFEVDGPVRQSVLSSQRRTLVRRLNYKPILGFLPGSLRLLSYRILGQGLVREWGYRYQFSWCPKRSATTFADGTWRDETSPNSDIRWDTHLPNLSEGFASLWAPRVLPRQGTLFEERI